MLCRNWASNLFILLIITVVYVITGNNASSLHYTTNPDLNNQSEKNKIPVNDGDINTLHHKTEQWSDVTKSGLHERQQQEDPLTLQYVSAHETKLNRQEKRLQKLERRMRLLDKTQQTCNDLLMKFNQLESHLKVTTKENTDLWKYLHALQEQIDTNNEFNGKNISSAMELRTTDSLQVGSENSHRNPRSIDSAAKVTYTTSDTVVNDEMEDTITEAPKTETKMVAFDAFRDKPFHEDQKYITFDGMNVNVGGAFNPKTGMFKAPVAGVYSFSFHGLTQDGTATYVKLVHREAHRTEWDNVAGTYRRHEKEEDEESKAPNSNNILKNAEGMLALSVLLELGKGDEVAVFSYHGNLRDGGWHYTHFTGYLIR